MGLNLKAFDCVARQMLGTSELSSRSLPDNSSCPSELCELVKKSRDQLPTFGTGSPGALQ